MGNPNVLANFFIAKRTPCPCLLLLLLFFTVSVAPLKVFYSIPLQRVDNAQAQHLHLVNADSSGRLVAVVDDSTPTPIAATAQQPPTSSTQLFARRLPYVRRQAVSIA